MEILVNLSNNKTLTVFEVKSKLDFVRLYLKNWKKLKTFNAHAIGYLLHRMRLYNSRYFMAKCNILATLVVPVLLEVVNNSTNSNSSLDKFAIFLTVRSVVCALVLVELLAAIFKS
jgi:hypothetical protein